MNKITRAVVALALLSLTALTSSTPARAGEARTHDGFFLRLAPGFGSASAKIEDGGSLEFSGSGSDGDLAIGGRVGNNLLLHATLWGWYVSGPKGELKVGGLSDSADLNGELMMSAFGGGLTYYMMPTNLYFTGSIGMGTLSSQIEDPFKGDSDSGVAYTLGIGKEWWAGNSWGLGLAGSFSYFSAKNKDIILSDKNWAGPSYGLRFSATFN
jgi:hypothetical protein